MKLEFLDSTSIEVVCIFGGPRLVNGVTRDTLSIEIDPSNNVDELKQTFSNTNKTNKLYVYNGEEKTQIGEGYNILVSCSKQRRKLDKEPGTISPDKFEEVIIVNLSQLTYDEYQQYLAGNWTPPVITG